MPLYLSDMLDRFSGRTRVRMVDVDTEYFRVARKYHVRIDRTDFENSKWLSRLARAGHLTMERFSERFGYLAEEDRKMIDG